MRFITYIFVIRMKLRASSATSMYVGRDFSVATNIHVAT